MVMSGHCCAVSATRGSDFQFEQRHRTEVVVVRQAVTEDGWHSAPGGSKSHTQTDMKLVPMIPSLRRTPALEAHRQC